MSILSMQFVCFLSILLICYYVVPIKYRWIVLLLGSYGFYAAGNWKCMFLILFTTVQTFFAAGRIDKLNGIIKDELKLIEDKEQRKIYLGMHCLHPIFRRLCRGRLIVTVKSPHSCIQGRNLICGISNWDFGFSFGACLRN